MRRSIGISASLLCALAFALAGCGQKTAAPDTSAASPGAAAVDAEAKAAAEAKSAELATKEQELAEREAALKEQEAAAEKAKQEADSAAAAAAAKKTAAKPATSTATTKSAAPPSPITVPAGTQLAVALSGNVNTKKVTVGTPVEGTLASDLVVGGRRAAKAGATVRGSVTQVISGTDKIGGIPTLGLRFDTIVAADGSTKTINASYTEQGKSETGKDTAKILGGAAAGAVIGHQVGNDDKGTVIGGLLGAGAGAAAAKKTGGDIKLVAGQVLNVTTTVAFEVKP